MKIRIGSRGSDLALWQAHFVKDQLTELNVGLKVEVDKLSTTHRQWLQIEKEVRKQNWNTGRLYRPAIRSQRR